MIQFDKMIETTTQTLMTRVIFSIYLEPKCPLFFEGQPPKTRPSPIKTRVIWVPGSF